MKRNLMVAAALAAGLALAGCGSSEGGTAAPVTNAPVSSQNTGSEVAPTDVTTPADETTSSEESTSADETTSVDETTSSEESTGGAGVADENTVKWFTTVCGGLSEVQNIGTSLGELAPKGDSTDLGAARDSLVDGLKPLAEKLSGFATELQGLQPPSIEGGEKINSALIESFGGMGTALNNSVEALAAADPSDPTAITEAVSGLSAEITTASGPLQEIGNLPNPGPEVEAAVAKIPECAPFFGS